jgi:Tol biopolymer transport system component
MRKFKIIFFVLSLFTVISAQEKTPQWLIGDVDNYYMHPVWSPDGSKIAFTESNYKGLWVIIPDGSNPVKISNETAAGWGFEWSADSKSILTRVAKFEGPRRLNAVKYFDIANDNAVQLTEYKSFMPGLPHWVDSDNNVLIFNKKRPEKIESQKVVEGLNPDDFPQYTCFLKGTKIAVYNNQNGEIKTLDPLNAAGYLNPVISNNGNKIAFEEYGGNLYVMNLDGSNLTDLGIGFTPDWSPDDKKLVYTISEDDGYRFTASDIYIIDLDTKEKTNITNSAELLEMRPNWSPNGKSIVFDESNSGIIYLLEL